MKTNFSAKVKSFIARKQVAKMEKQTKDSLNLMNQKWDQLTTTLKKYKELDKKYQEMLTDSKKFYSDNTEDYATRNVAVSKNFSRSKWLLTGVLVISSALAVKGLKYFINIFYGPLPVLMIYLFAFIFAWLIVTGSIYMHSFAGEYRNKSLGIFYLLRIAAFLLILFVPAMNLMEGFDSNYSTFVMILNIFGIIVDVTANAALVSMSGFFVQAENAKKAKSIIRNKLKVQNDVEQEMQDLSINFKSQKDAFESAAREFVHEFKKLELNHPVIAADIMFLLGNFIIWMINNKVYMHAVLNYHSNQLGSPVVEQEFFSPDENRLRMAYEELGRINFTKDVIQQGPSPVPEESDNNIPDQSEMTNPIDEIDDENDPDDGLEKPNNENDKYL